MSRKKIRKLIKFGDWGSGRARETRLVHYSGGGCTVEGRQDASVIPDRTMKNRKIRTRAALAHPRILPSDAAVFNISLRTPRRLPRNRDITLRIVYISPRRMGARDTYFRKTPVLAKLHERRIVRFPQIYTSPYPGKISFALLNTVECHEFRRISHKISVKI